MPQTRPTFFFPTVYLSNIDHPSSSDINLPSRLGNQIHFILKGLWGILGDAIKETANTLRVITQPRLRDTASWLPLVAVQAHATYVAFSFRPCLESVPVGRLAPRSRLFIEYIMYTNVLPFSSSCLIVRVQSNLLIYVLTQSPLNFFHGRAEE